MCPRLQGIGTSYQQIQSVIWQVFAIALNEMLSFYKQVTLKPGKLEIMQSGKFSFSLRLSPLDVGPIGLNYMIYATSVSQTPSPADDPKSQNTQAAQQDLPEQIVRQELGVWVSLQNCRKSARGQV